MLFLNCWRSFSNRVRRFLGGAFGGGGGFGFSTFLTTFGGGFFFGFGGGRGLSIRSSVPPVEWTMDSPFWTISTRQAMLRCFPAGLSLATATLKVTSLLAESISSPGALTL